MWFYITQLHGMGHSQLGLLWSIVIITQEDQDVVAYFGEDHRVWHGCPLRTMRRLIMLSPQLTGHGQRGCTPCPGFLLLSRNIDVCSLGVLKCSLILCFWTNTVSLHCMISNSSFNPNSLHYTQRLGSPVRNLGQLLTQQCHFQAIRVWETCSLTFLLISPWPRLSLLSLFIPLVIINSSNPIKVKRRNTWYLSFQTAFIYKLIFHTKLHMDLEKTEKLWWNYETFKKLYPLWIPKHAPKGTENDNYDVFLNGSLTAGRIGWMTYWMDMHAMLASLGVSNKWRQSVGLKQEEFMIS